MKYLLSAFLLLGAVYTSAQNKAGIFEYGNASLLIAPARDAGNTDIVQYLLKQNEIAFNEEEDHIYIRTNDENYYFKQNPDKKIFAGWNLFTREKEVFDASKLPATRKGRSILALFTPNKPLPAYRNEKSERSGWQNELWISADLKINVTNNFTITILDTNNTKITTITLPNPVNDYKTDRWKYTKEKPKDYDVDLSFCYYAKNNLLYICGSWGFRFPTEAERVWQYNLANNTLTEIPLLTINAKEIDYNSKTVFRNEYMIRTIKETGSHLAIPSYEILSLTDGKLVANSKEPADTRYPLPLTPLGYLPGNKQMISFDFDKLNYYNKDMQYQRSFTLDMGKGVTFEEPAIISKSGKFIAFIKIFKHPEIGYYYSVNYDLFDDLKNGYITSLNDNSIHAPLITQDYATQDLERKKKLISDKQKEVDRLTELREQTVNSLKKLNTELTNLYNAGNFAALLARGDIWTTENADYSWEIGQTNMLNTATRYNFRVTYDIRFETATAQSGNYVNMAVREHTEAHEGFKLITQEDKLSGESYYKPATGSHTLIRNPNYRFGNTYINYDKPEARQFLYYLEKYTDLFNGNSFEIIQQQQIGIPLIVLKYPAKVTGKYIYVYTQDILGLLKDHISKTKEIGKLLEEIKAIHQK